MDIRVITHYEEDDTKFEGEYLGMSVHELGCCGILSPIMSYGSFADHQCGIDAIDGFISGLNYALDGDVNVVWEDAADSEAPDDLSWKELTAMWQEDVAKSNQDNL